MYAGVNKKNCEGRKKTFVVELPMKQIFHARAGFNFAKLNLPIIKLSTLSLLSYTHALDLVSPTWDKFRWVLLETPNTQEDRTSDL